MELDSALQPTPAVVARIWSIEEKLDRGYIEEQHHTLIVS